MNYDKKFYIALAVAIISGSLVLNGAALLQGSMGNQQILWQGVIMLCVGLPFFVVAGPATIYFYNRRKDKADPTTLEVETLAHMKETQDHEDTKKR